jgi:hypothetical protein
MKHSNYSTTIFSKIYRITSIYLQLIVSLKMGIKTKSSAVYSIILYKWLKLGNREISNLINLIFNLFIMVGIREDPLIEIFQVHKM